MKTSKLIIISCILFMLASFVTCLLMIRKDVLIRQINEDAESGLKTINSEEFEVLYFSGNWNVAIRQGRSCKVEMDAAALSLPSRILHNKPGHFQIISENGTGPVQSTRGRIRITLPVLKELKAINGPSIHMQGFDADSIHIVLEDDVFFNGKSTQFSKTIFETSGKVRLQLSGDDME